MERIMAEGEYAYGTHSTGHSASFDTEMADANECKDADSAKATGHSASFDTEMADANECKDADSAKATGHSASTANVKTKGTDPRDDLVARMKKLKISTKFEANIPSALPIKQNMYVGMDTTWQRYLENMYLLGMAWVRKVQHIARLTLNSPTGPVWPTNIEPLALDLFDFLRSFSVDWTRVRERADFADEIDFVWRVKPPWLPPIQMMYIPIWEYVTGMARTWGWNWHNEARKRGAPQEVWRREDSYPRSRYHQNISSASQHHHVLSALRVPTIANYIRTNKFYRVGDDETTCETARVVTSLPRQMPPHGTSPHPQDTKEETWFDTRSQCRAGERIRRHRMSRSSHVRLSQIC